MEGILDAVPGKSTAGAGAGAGLAELVGSNINTGLLRFDGGNPRFATKDELKEDPLDPDRSLKRHQPTGRGFDLMALIFGNDPNVMF